MNSTCRKFAIISSAAFILFGVLYPFSAPIGDAQQNNEPWNDPFFKPYVEQLKRETPRKSLDSIRELRREDLILLHLGYGMWIRNKWLWGNREPKLVEHFHSKGINHPDDMSGVLIEALWMDLNANLTAEQQQAFALKRSKVTKKSDICKRICEECTRQVYASSKAFDECNARFGPFSKNRENHEPFSRLFVNSNGKVGQIEFYKGASKSVKRCVEDVVGGFSFSPFEYHEKLTLYITSYPRCRVEEMDSLYVQ